MLFRSGTDWLVEKVLDAEGLFTVKTATLSMYARMAVRFPLAAIAPALILTGEVDELPAVGAQMVTPADDAEQTPLALTVNVAALE